jgi:hypothetical protein
MFIPPTTTTTTAHTYAQAARLQLATAEATVAETASKATADLAAAKTLLEVEKRTFDLQREMLGNQISNLAFLQLEESGHGGATVKEKLRAAPILTILE